MLQQKIIEELKTSTGKTYLKIKFDLAENWVYSDWIGYPTPENVAKGALTYLDLMKAENLNCILNNNRNLVGRWDQSLDWVEKVWLPYAVQSGLKYFAHIASSESLSADAAHTMQHLVKDYINMKVFNDLGSAKGWLRSVNNLA